MARRKNTGLEHGNDMAMTWQGEKTQGLRTWQEHGRTSPCAEARAHVDDDDDEDDR